MLPEHEAGTGAGAPPSPTGFSRLRALWRGAPAARGSATPAPRERPKHSLRIGGVADPVILPSCKDPRLHVSGTFVLLHALGQTEFHFRLSFPQIATSILTCALIEVVVTFWRKR